MYLHKYSCIHTLEAAEHNIEKQTGIYLEPITAMPVTVGSATADSAVQMLVEKYRVTTINVSRIWIEWAEWAALTCTANSPFPGHVYCSHPVQWVYNDTLGL